MKRFTKLLPVITAACLVILLLLIAWQCIDIYFFTPSAAGRIYTYENVTGRINSILPFTAVCMVLVVLALVFSPSRKSAPPAQGSPCKHKSSYLNSRLSMRTCRFLRGILLMLAIVLIVWGVFNGGLYDVLVKAINICTECIGLG